MRGHRSFRRRIVRPFLLILGLIIFLVVWWLAYVPPP